MPIVKEPKRITRYRGDTTPLNRTVKVIATGAVQSLAGVTEIALTVRETTEDTTIMLDRRYTDGEITITSESGGTFQVTWNLDTMEALTPNERGYEYDIEITFADGVETVERGKFIVRADVTRPSA